MEQEGKGEWGKGKENDMATLGSALGADAGTMNRSERVICLLLTEHAQCACAPGRRRWSCPKEGQGLPAVAIADAQCDTWPPGGQGPLPLRQPLTHGGCDVSRRCITGY